MTIEHTIELKPIRDVPSEYDIAEERIKEAFREFIYLPLLREFNLPDNTIKNDNNALHDALQSGRISFSHGRFSGKFGAKLSAALRRLGAKWDRKTGTFKIRMDALPPEIKMSISASSVRFAERLRRLDKKLSQILPEIIADSVKVSDVFDSSLFKVDRQLRESTRAVTVMPQLTDEQRAKISAEWQDNMRLYIKDFSEQEIKSLRKKIVESTFSGNRRESVIKTIQKSYGTSAAKAKFLARQETSLLMTKFKEVRYTDAGINEYKWTTVRGSPNHPVRESHKILDGKIFRWDDPPITTAPNEPARRNNPGEDYNCRCAAIPIVRRRTG